MLQPETAQSIAASSLAPLRVWWKQNLLTMKNFLKSVNGRRFVCEYYVLNVLLLLTFVGFRQKALQQNLPVNLVTAQLQHLVGGLGDYQNLEFQAFAACSTMAVYRGFRASTVDAMLSTIISHSQLFVAVMALVTIPAAGICYAAAFLLIYLLFPQPIYSGGDKVEILNPVTLKEQVLDSESDEAYIIYFHTNWDQGSRHAYSMFAALSNHYTTNKVHFCKFDLSEWPHVATELSMDISPVSKELPTYACFEKGQQLLRLPQPGAASTALTKPDIIRAFELDMRFARSMQPKSTGKKQ